MNRSAEASAPDSLDDARATVTTITNLVGDGCTHSAIRAQWEARRWQRFGRAVVLHNGPLGSEERARVGLANCGPRAALTAFTAASLRGLCGWEREEIHVLVPGGARVRRVRGIRLRVHWTGNWEKASCTSRNGVLAVEPALLAAASILTSPRSACGIVAAGVQQRLTTTQRLITELHGATRVRHRAAVASALADIGQGSEALSELDLVRLCRRHRLPVPIRQVVRIERSGRRRYLDAEWIRADGQRVVVEIDGALHLIARRWWDDQLRQNEVVIGGSIVLRYPSVVLRFEEPLVVDQLRRALVV